MAKRGESFVSPKPQPRQVSAFQHVKEEPVKEKKEVNEVLVYGTKVEIKFDEQSKVLPVTVPFSFLDDKVKNIIMDSLR